MAPPSGYLITPSAMQPVRSANDTTEFRRNYSAAEFTNALYALDAGHSGQRVTVGVIDDGVVNANGELDGRLSPLSRDFGYVTSGGVRTKRDVIGDAQSNHGTPVANIIGAARNGTGTVGFAPDVTIAALRISDWDADTKTEVLLHFIEALNYAGTNKIKVVNSSLSSDGSSYWASAITRFGQTGGLVVNSAGNDSEAAPNDAAGVNDSNRAAILFVGSLSPALTGTYQLEKYSNRAGTMKDRYVVAPGSNVTTLVSGSVGVFSGTSSAAPVVTGLAATILSKWPQLSGQQAGDIILNTAKDIGAPGVDDVFGHGLVDFEAALSPINPVLSNGARTASVDASVMAVPTVMGKAALQNALSDVTVLDAYGRDYAGSVAGMVIQPAAQQGHWLRRRVEQMQGGTRAFALGGFAGSFGVAAQRVGPRAGEVRAAPTAGELSFVNGGFGVRAGWNAQDSLQSDVMGLAPFADGVLAYVPQAGNSLGVDRYTRDGSRIGLTLALGRAGAGAARAATLGWSRPGTDVRLSLIDEDETVMGMPTGLGALRLGRGARTMLVEAHRTLDLASGWALEGYGSLGITRLKIDRASLVTGATPILGSRLGVQASHAAWGGLVSLGLAQPLAIESGAARLTIANGYDQVARALTYSQAEASLAGPRRVQLTAGYAKGGPASQFRLGLMGDPSQGAVSALAAWQVRY